MTTARWPESFATLTTRHIVASSQASDVRDCIDTPRPAEHATAGRAIERLLRRDGSPAGAADEFLWLRDALGRPFIEWTGALANWAELNGMLSRHLHVSNTHDGGAHIVIAAYDTELVGIGIDAVWLPRLRRPGKDRLHLLRFASRFMCPEEWAAFQAGQDTPWSVSPSIDPDESLRLRVAAHFSLMEAASKACGTGLKMGVGMGRETSLPKQSVGVLRLSPTVELLFGPEAVERLRQLGMARYEACVYADAEFLVSAVALYRSHPRNAENEAGGMPEKT